MKIFARFFFALKVIYLFTKLIKSNKLEVTNLNLCDLLISTDDTAIISNCTIKDAWEDRIKLEIDKNYIELYEPPENTRRIFTIDYHKDSEFSESKSPIVLTSVTIQSLNNLNSTNPVIYSDKFPYTINQGDSMDLIVEYNCIKNWDDIQISLLIEGENPITFHYKKMCTDNFINKFDFTYIVLSLCYLLCIHFSRNDFLINKEHFVQINTEEIAQAKNAEKIFLIMTIIVFVILFFIVIGYIYFISSIFAMILAVISVKSCVKYLLNLALPSCMESLTNISFVFIYFQLDIAKILCYAISIFFYVAYLFLLDGTWEILLNNINTFIITYFLIHKVNWNKFFFILGMFIIVVGFDIYKIFFTDENLTKNKGTVYNLTTEHVINSPIRFIIPDMISTPFNVVYFFSLCDLVLLGFTLRYLERCKKLNSKYFTIGIYCTVIGIFINLLLFYFAGFSAPISMLPCIFIVIASLGYSISVGEFWDFCELDKQKSKKKTPFDVQLGIIGADHSEDFANLTGDYIPPSVYQINERKESEEKEEEDNDNVDVDEKYLNVEERGGNKYSFVEETEKSPSPKRVEMDEIKKDDNDKKAINISDSQ